MTDSKRDTSAPAPGFRDAFRWRSGGWVIWLALVLAAGAALWWTAYILRALREPAIGDGENVETYQFDLDPLLVDRDLLVASPLPKDRMPVLDHPDTVPGREVAAINARSRGKFLVSGDRVVGVALAGRTVAYPLRMLNWHEIANDRFGDIPVAVTYSPLCDSAVVFDRRVDGEEITFGHSGLLYNSNLLMYDRREGSRGESLWCQLQFRAVAGPAAAAGKRLAMLPFAVMPWADWLERHPDTEVLAPNALMSRHYKRSPYGSYYSSDELRFPVRPLSDEKTPGRKARVLAIGDGRQWQVWTVRNIAERTADSPDLPGWPISFAGSELQVAARVEPIAAWLVDPPSDDLFAIPCLWFAWHAMHPDTCVY
jgi:hypothetical protein